MRTIHDARCASIGQPFRPGPALRVLAEQTAREVGATIRVRCPARRYEPAVEALVYRTVGEALASRPDGGTQVRFSVPVGGRRPQTVA